ncbi:MAG: ABC transporter permease subunit [Lysinibacillus sp.]
MDNFSILLKKEFREVVRSWKILWIPLVFAILGMTDPLTMYYMKDILAAVGNLPEGFEMLMPELAPADVLQASISQFQLIGLLVVIAAFIGSISKERASGTATLLYVRPISFNAYFMSKFIVMGFVIISSAVAGFAASVYYTTILYDGFEVPTLLAAMATYSVWLLFVLAIILLMSAAFNTVVAATGAFIIVFVGQIADTVVGAFWTVSPWKLPVYGVELIRGNMDMGNYWWSMGITGILIIICVICGIFAMKKNASKAKI